MPPRYDNDPALVRAAQAGDADAFTSLYRHWFDPCFDVARRILHDDGVAGEVAQETFLMVWNQIGTLRDPAAFGGWVLRSARNKALNRLDRERRSVATDDAAPTFAQLAASTDVEGEVSRAGARDLVWAAAAALGPRDASVLDLHLRHGLDASELAAELDVTTNNAYQLLFRMKARLGAAIRAFVLHRDGAPVCDRLRAELDATGLVFGPATVKLIERHVAACEVCDREQAAVLAPEAMFAAVPLLVAGPGLRETVAAGLRAAGVPLGPSATTPIGSSIDAPSPTSSPATGAPSSPRGEPPTAPEPGAPAGPPVPPFPPVLVLPPERRRDTEAAPPIEPPPEDAPPSRRLALAAAAIVVVLLLGGGTYLAATGDEPADVLAGPATSTVVPFAPVGSDPTPTSPRSGTAPSTGPDLADDVGDASPTTTTAVVAVPTTAPTPMTPPIPTTAVAPPTLVATDPTAPDPGPTVPTPDPTSLSTVTVTTSPPPPPPPPSTTTTTTPPAPTIDQFTYVPPSAPGGSCGSGWPTILTWSTSGATTVAVEATGVTPKTGLPTSGTTVVCRATPGKPPGGWTLRATGPGGTVTRTAP